MATAVFDTSPSSGEPTMLTREGKGRVDFDAHSGQMVVTSDPINPADAWATGTIELGDQYATAGAFLGTPAPLYPPVSGDVDGAAHDWDIETGLRERDYTAAPSPTGLRWISSTTPGVPVDFDDDEQFIETRTLDVAADGSWTHTKITYVERFIIVHRVVIDADQRFDPPAAEVRQLLTADPVYIAMTSQSSAGTAPVS